MDIWAFAFLTFLSLVTHIFFGFRRFYQGAIYFGFGIVWLVVYFDHTLTYPDSVLALGGFLGLWTFISTATFYVGSMVTTAIDSAD